jgi:hypothetical protein
MLLVRLWVSVLEKCARCRPPPYLPHPSPAQIRGTGAFAWPDGSKYEGEVEGGKRHGEGVFWAAPPSPVVYQGQWRNGLRHGKVRLRCPRRWIRVSVLCVCSCEWSCTSLAL